MKGLIAVATTGVVALTLGAGSAVSAPNYIQQGLRLCERQGGEGTSLADGWRCDKPAGFTERQEFHFSKLCNRANNNGGYGSVGEPPVSLICVGVA